MTAAERMNAVKTAADFVRGRLGGRKPEIGVVLGSGLGNVADEIEDAVCIPYAEIPGFPISTAIGHKGNFICGKLEGKCVLAMQGRFHYYEGYTLDKIVMPIRVMAVLGVSILVVSNAVGGVNRSFKQGDIMVINDHINTIPNPLIGPNMPELGTRFPDMTCAYDRELVALLHQVASELGYELRDGVLYTCSGPCYETPAEYEYIRRIGGDVVGMSTTYEVITARHAGMRVMGMSVITDVAHEQTDDYETDGEEIVRIADEASHKMTAILKGAFRKL